MILTNEDLNLLNHNHREEFVLELDHRIVVITQLLLIYHCPMNRQELSIENENISMKNLSMLEYSIDLDIEN